MGTECLPTMITKANLDVSLVNVNTGSSQLITFGALWAILCFNYWVCPHVVESNHGSANVLRQHKFLTRVLERLNSAEECGQVLAEVDSVRQILSHPGNLALHLATNLDLLATKHPDPASCWTELLPPTKQSVKNKSVTIFCLVMCILKFNRKASEI